MSEQIYALLSDASSLYTHYFGFEPSHLIIETLCVIVIVYLLLQGSYNPKVVRPAPLTDREIDQVVKDWNPAPLTPKLDDYTKWKVNCAPTLLSGPSPKSTLISTSTKPLLNVSSYNFLGLADNQECQKVAISTLRKYGCGSCGPRGFYGTMDLHLALEAKIAKYMSTEESIIYSSAFATITSAIPAFANRNDLIFCDKGVTHAVQTGCMLSRARVVYFDHNDLKDLEKLLQNMVEEEKKQKKDHTSYRSFVVVEGLYNNYGDLVPLPELIKLKNRYKFRIIMEDSMGIGAIGKTGRGTTEYFGVDVKEIDVLTGSLASSFGSDGGFCCGKKSVVFHQRLNASGYVFSASSPPFLVAAAIRSMELIDENNGKLQADLKNNVHELRNGLKEVFGLQVCGDVDSPITHLRLTKSSGKRSESEMLLQAIVDKATSNGVLLCRANYVDLERFLPPPSIRVIVSASHSIEDVRTSVSAIRAAAESVLGP